MIKAIGFDYGNTLLDTKLRYNFKDYYDEVIKSVLQEVKAEVNSRRIQIGKDVLLKYNTRVNPREYEVESNTIFSELFHEWGISDSSQMEIAKSTFASFFFNRSIPYPEIVNVLREIKQRGYQTGVLTNVPYGMEKKYLLQEPNEIIEYIDVFITSVEVGFRKPNPAGYRELADRMGIDTSGCMFVGDEKLDIIGANTVGMVSVLIDRDAQNKDYGQDHTISTLSDILILIK
jgi:putative hydrolase of the HAD superfamily